MFQNANVKRYNQNLERYIQENSHRFMFEISREISFDYNTVIFKVSPDYIRFFLKADPERPQYDPSKYPLKEDTAFQFKFFIDETEKAIEKLKNEILARARGYYSDDGMYKKQCYDPDLKEYCDEYGRLMIKNYDDIMNDHWWALDHHLNPYASEADNIIELQRYLHDIRAYLPTSKKYRDEPYKDLDFTYEGKNNRVKNDNVLKDISKRYGGAIPDANFYKLDNKNLESNLYYVNLGGKDGLEGTIQFASPLQEYYYKNYYVGEGHYLDKSPDEIDTINVADDEIEKLSGEEYVCKRRRTPDKEFSQNPVKEKYDFPHTAPDCASSILYQGYATKVALMEKIKDYSINNHSKYVNLLAAPYHKLNKLYDAAAEKDYKGRPINKNAIQVAKEFYEKYHDTAYDKVGGSGFTMEEAYNCLRTDPEFSKRYKEAVQNKERAAAGKKVKENHYENNLPDKLYFDEVEFLKDPLYIAKNFHSTLYNSAYGKLVDNLIPEDYNCTTEAQKNALRDQYLANCAKDTIRLPLRIALNHCPDPNRINDFTEEELNEYRDYHIFKDLGYIGLEGDGYLDSESYIPGYLMAPNNQLLVYPGGEKPASVPDEFIYESKTADDMVNYYNSFFQKEEKHHSFFGR